MPPHPFGRETLDDPHADAALVTRIVRDLPRANRWLGGAAAVEYGIGRLVRTSDRGSTLTLIDIGTGAGDLPRVAARWGARRGITIAPLGVERLRCAAQLATRNGVPTAVGVAETLPLRPRSVDIVLMSQTLHHFDRAGAMTLIGASMALARRGVVIADLSPFPLAGPGFRLAGLALGLHRVTIDDGVTSLRRGFTRASLAELCREAGADRLHIAVRPLARIVAVIATGPAA